MLGGKLIGEPVFHYRPFVMNTKKDYQAGRLGTIPAQPVPHRHPGDVDPTTKTDKT